MSWFTRWFGKSRRVVRANRRRTAARLRVEGLEDRQVPAVIYFGGNVLPHVEAQALFLGNEWSGANAAQTATLNASLKDLTGGAYMDALTRAGYNVGRGTATAGAVDNRALALGSTITDASIQADIKADIASGLLQAPDANRLYVVYVEPNVAVNLGAGQGTTRQGILGYHGAFAGANGATIRYAVVAYPGGSVNNTSMGTAAIDQLTSVTSHEVAEGVTDPDVNFGQLGWYDPRRGEIGDITANNPNAEVRLDGYLVQEVADQNDQLLSITAPPAPPTTPTTPTAPTGSVTTTTSLTAGSVRYHFFSPPTVTLTVTIAPGSGSAVPGGTVALLYNGSVLGTAKVRMVNGVATATFNVMFFGSGDFMFTAQYQGSGQFGASTSSAVTVTV
jgi:hypothetical protein